MTDLLLELGTEELPPLHLAKMSQALGETFAKQLIDNRIGFGAIETYNSPRRLALIARDIDEQQPSIEQVKRGPALANAYDANNHPTQALLGFAKSCKLEITELSTIETEKGTWLSATTQIIGRKTKDLIADFFKQALNQLPIDRRMRWGDCPYEFVRPVHWLVAMWDDEPIEFELFGIASNAMSRGHRFHADKPIALSPTNYVSALKDAKVWVDANERQAYIKKEVTRLAGTLGGKVQIQPALLSEVASLVEFPVALAGQFDEVFLQVPPEAIVAFMEGHQKFFAVFADDGSLLPHFITISNIESKNPASIISGNERVIYPRLADALFFWQQDQKQDLKAQTKLLKKVVYQEKLGSVWDKVERIKVTAGALADWLGVDKAHALAAANLCKTDLLSQMVGEFPKLQGVMGKYYAEQSGVHPLIAEAIEAHYLPRFADDKLPKNAIGQLIAIADRLDTLVGIFAIGQIPTGDKDPFGLRRAALGVLRIIIECGLNLDLWALIELADEQLPCEKLSIKAKQNLIDFMQARLKGMIGGSAFTAIDLRKSNGDVLDFVAREKAVSDFINHESFDTLAQANKRIANFFAKSNLSHDTIEVQVDLFEVPSEHSLWQTFVQISPQVKEKIEANDYIGALNTLAKLAPTIDSYFDHVMVMCDDENIRNNRLSTLNQVRNLFLEIADLSKLLS